MDLQFNSKQIGTNRTDSILDGLLLASVPKKEYSSFFALVSLNHFFTPTAANEGLAVVEGSSRYGTGHEVK